MRQAEKAVALRYADGLPAPLILASGRGRLAEAITRIAKESGVILVEDPTLVDALITLEVNSFIPESLYEVIAELLAFVRQLETDR